MKRLSCILISLLFITSYVTQVFAEEPSIESLQKQMDSLEKRVIVLENILIGNNSSNQETKKNTIDSEIEGQQSTNIIGLELLDMTYHKSDESNNYANGYSDWITFKFKFTNNSPKAINAFKGAAVFADIFGDVWWRIGISQTLELQPQESKIWEGQMDYNQFIDSHKRAIHTDLKDIFVTFAPDQIYYSDGTKVKF